jgi:hypothetical protein
MKTKSLASALALAFILLSLLWPRSAVGGRAAGMIFWYPGEAGSTEEAQPFLDVFLAYLNDKIGPYVIEGQYFNTIEDGLAYIKKSNPKVGIISFAAWIQYRQQLGRPVDWLSTLPLPHGQPMERYALVGRTKTIAPNTPIFSSEPFTIEFVREKLFPRIPANAKLSSTPQLLYTLRRIASGQIEGAAILTPTEAATLKRLTAPWAKDLLTIAQSEPVPTARVVLFDPEWKGAAKLKEAFLASGTDPKAKEILSELRLKGFAGVR